MNKDNITRRDFLGGALKTSLAISTAAFLGAETVFGQKNAAQTVFKTAHGNLIIKHNPLAIAVTDAGGKVLTETVAGDALTINSKGEADKLARVVKANQAANGMILECVTAKNKTISLQLSATVSSIKLEVKTAGAETVLFKFKTSENEFLSGGGQRIRSLNLQGYNINSVARVNDDGIVKVGSNEDEFSAPTPFFLSQKGYAAFVETEGLWNFDFAKAEKDTIAVLIAGNVVNLHFFTGETPKKLVQTFTELSGRMQPAPDWNYGLWKWRDVYVNEFEVYEDVSMMRSLDLPATALIIDSPWSSKHVSFDINPKQFPNGKNFSIICIEQVINSFFGSSRLSIRTRRISKKPTKRAISLKTQTAKRCSLIGGIRPARPNSVWNRLDSAE
ncbi:MAG: hypothetical protein HC846_13525 [Blastocatellia bacterium]|nr:hypothetical protein [Blastocatellia bacterium]